MKTCELLIVFLIFSVSIANAVDCIDYGLAPASAGLFVPEGDAQGVEAIENLMYLIGGSLTVVDVSEPTTPMEIGSLELSSSLSCLAIADGRLFAGTGFSTTLQVIDITDPTTPSLLANLATSHNITAVDVAGDYAYTIGGFAMDFNYFQVVDISDLANPNVVSVIQTMNVDAIGSVQAVGNRVFITNTYQGLGVVDVADPNTPVLTWNSLSGNTTSLDIVNSIACVGGYVTINEGILHVIDIQDPDAPVILGSLELPSIVRDVVIQNDIAYCGIDEGLAVVLIADPTSPELMGVLDQGRTLGVGVAPSCVCSAIEFAGMGIAYPHCPVLSIVGDLPVSKLELLQVAPNPFNPVTVATFNIQWPQILTVRVYDARGGLVREIASGWHDTGVHRVQWNGLDSSGRGSPSGTYFFKIEGANESVVQAVSLIK